MKLALVLAVVIASVAPTFAGEMRCYRNSDGSTQCYQTGNGGYNPWSDYSGRSMR
jgi:hypothetical protein